MKKQDGAWGRIRTTDTRIFKRRVSRGFSRPLADWRLENAAPPPLGRITIWKTTWRAEMRPTDRIRSILDERRWRDYVRVPGSPSIFYRWQGAPA